MRERQRDFSPRRRFEFACLGLLSALEHACMPMLNPSPLGPYVPYYGEPVAVVLWQVHYVVRCARTLGLYPTTAQLEQERLGAATSSMAVI